MILLNLMITGYFPQSLVTMVFQENLGVWGFLNYLIIISSLLTVVNESGAMCTILIKWPPEKNRQEPTSLQFFFIMLTGFAAGPDLMF